jgi:hypothetical protein
MKYRPFLVWYNVPLPACVTCNVRIEFLNLERKYMCFNGFVKTDNSLSNRQ